MQWIKLDNLVSCKQPKHSCMLLVLALIKCEHLMIPAINKTDSSCIIDLWNSDMTNELRLNEYGVSLAIG